GRAYRRARARRAGHGPPLDGHTGRGPERGHEGHLRRHGRRAARPGVPLHGPARRGPPARVAVGAGTGMRSALRRVLPAVFLAGLAACSHGQPDIATLTSNSDQVIWEAGQKALHKHEWDSARQHFKRIIDAFPQSQYAPSARLALGDSYIQEGGTANDILAI